MANTSQRITPRLSASQLADYLVAPTPIGQMGTLRQAKYPVQSKSLIIQYQFARKCIASCLQSPVETPKIVGGAVAALEQRRDDSSHSPLVRDDAIRSINAIAIFERASNSLREDGYKFEVLQNRNVSITIEGVEISVSPDAIAHSKVRNVTRVGGVFIRCTLGAAGEAAEARRLEANTYLATIAHLYALEALGGRGTPHPPSSMVIDVTREVVVRGPVNSKRRIDNINAACAMIAAIWGRL